MLFPFFFFFFFLVLRICIVFSLFSVCFFFFVAFYCWRWQYNIKMLKENVPFRNFAASVFYVPVCVCLWQPNIFHVFLSTISVVSFYSLFFFLNINLCSLFKVLLFFVVVYVLSCVTPNYCWNFVNMMCLS